MITVDKLSKNFTLHILNEKKIEACRDISFQCSAGRISGAVRSQRRRKEHGAQMPLPHLPLHKRCHPL